LVVGRPTRPESVKHALDRAPRLARAGRISRDDRQEAIAPQRVQLEVSCRLNRGGTPHSAQQSDLPEALTWTECCHQATISNHIGSALLDHVKAIAWITLVNHYLAGGHVDWL
jgi:hypothetical protein